MVFGIFTDAVENAFDVISDTIDGEIDKRKIAKLIDAGITIAAIAAAFGVAEEVVQKLIDD